MNLSWIFTLLVTLIAVEHILIGLGEMFGSSELQANAFEMDPKFLAQKNAKIALGNQGIYNIMLGIIILIILFFIEVPVSVFQIFMFFIMAVGIYGGFTATRKIWFTQALPALIVLILLFFVK